MLQNFKFLKISDDEFSTPDALRADGFNRSAHSAGPSRDSRSELSGMEFGSLNRILVY